MIAFDDNDDDDDDNTSYRRRRMQGCDCFDANSIAEGTCTAEQCTLGWEYNIIATLSLNII